jgi:hypothetical protein
MATTANSGIQTLLEAEKEAAKVVAKARQCWFPSFECFKWRTLLTFTI